MAFKMLSKFTCLLLVGSALLLEPGCEALFNRGNDGGNNKNGIAVQGGGKNAQTEDDRMQAINDAATGTVKQTAPGSERPPSTCNEMMARAVVLANEERALAYDERDDALETAQRAYAGLGETNLELTAANKKMSAAEEALETLQQSTELVIKTTKDEAQLEIDTHRNNTLLEMGTLKNNTALQITMHQNEKKTAVEAAETKAADEIAAYKELRDKEVATIQQEAKDQIEKATQTVLDNESASRLEIQQIQAQAKEDVDAANAHAEEVELVANATIEQVREEANDRIHAAGVTANNLVEQIKADSSRQIIVMQETLAKAEAEANAAVEGANILAKEAIAKAEAEANVAVEEANILANEAIDNMTAGMERERAVLKAEQLQLYETSNATVTQMQESSDAEIKSAKEAADEQVAQMKKEADENVAASEQAAVAKVAAIQKESEESQAEANDNIAASKQAAAAKVAAIQKELEESQAEAKRLVAAVEKLKTKGYSYADQVSHFTDELAHWKQLHQSQPYCNMTLMKVESFRALEKAAAVVSKEAKNVFDKTSTTTSQHFDRTALLLRETSQPHLEALEKAIEPHFHTLKQAYKESPVKDIVDTQLYPLYLKTAVPAFKATDRLIHKALRKMQTLTRQGWGWTTRKGIKVAAWELEMIDSNPHLRKWTPAMVVQFLTYIKANMEEWLILKLKITAVICAIVFRTRVLQVMKASIKFPFQVLWFFCPLRFCVGGKKKTIEEDEIKKEVAATTSKLDVTKNGVEPKQEEGTNGKGGHAITQ
jgi:hypothetical protein